VPAAIQTLQLADAPLKHLLRLFTADAPLHIQVLGDTQHPGAGYVDEALVRGITRVGELLAFPYDFAGLVSFEALAADITITYRAEGYLLVGQPKAIQRLLAQLRHLNAQPDAPTLLVFKTGSR
jgi:hypothetical protein